MTIFGLMTNALLSRWHWRAFLTGGGNAIWLLAYGLFYWASRLSLDSFSSFVLYMGYLLLLVILDFLVTGRSLTGIAQPGTDHIYYHLMTYRYNRILGHVLGNTEIVRVDQD